MTNKARITHGRKKAAQRGLAMVIVLMLSSIVLIFIAMGLRMATNSMKDSSKQFARQAQVSNIARAGLQDAIGWFKRQSVQPVRNNQATPPFNCATNLPVSADMVFNPQFNTDPLLSDTDDASIGLVKDIHLTGNLYGRYTIKRQPCSTTVDPHAAHDYSEEKGKGPNGSGIIWFVESQGVLYQRNNFHKTGHKFTYGPDQGPAGSVNRIMQKASVAVEIQRLDVNIPPYPVSLTDGAGAASTSTVNSRCNVMSDVNAQGGIYTHNASVSGTPLCSLPNSNCIYTSGTTVHQSIETVFGVTQTELKALSDYIYNNISNVPKKLPLGIHYLEGGGTGTFTFDASKPLTGSGILFVNGNLALSNGASSSFNGVVYVTGSLSVGNGNSLGGATLANSLTCNPGSGLAILEYNKKVVDNMRQKLGLYRENALTFRISEN